MNSHQSRPARSGRRVTAKLAAVTAGALALALGTTVAASASQGTQAAGKAETAQPVHSAKTAFSAQSPNTAALTTWSFGIDGRDSAGRMWSYAPGDFSHRDQTGYGMNNASAFFKNNPAGNGTVYTYARFGGTLRIFRDASADAGDPIGNGWDVYNAFVTPGNIGGASNPDLLARDKSGVLWEYLSYSDGNFAKRVKVGGGWNTYNQIAGRDDLTGDGKPDIVARDSSGVLWLYKGTGNYKAPFTARTRIGSGWNTYNKILGLGDTNADYHNDLIARDYKGVLWLYKGTGSASAPYQKRVQIGTGWNTYNYLF
ncbi:VCBS repeat-containing protein [Streptomyces sp. HPF1205]|uniref:FG-GAP repeat domain-containing protein n=1 Tax=Streptomyces sp. HPF1205 TaxID=2873262 RepID=UPI001CEC535C|nr:VCBS repeat-containing protein [Streptomyces sp. HPF1205]